MKILKKQAKALDLYIKHQKYCFEQQEQVQQRIQHQGEYSCLRIYRLFKIYILLLFLLQKNFFFRLKLLKILENGQLALQKLNNPQKNIIILIKQNSMKHFIVFHSLVVFLSFSYNLMDAVIFQCNNNATCINLAPLKVTDPTTHLPDFNYTPIQKTNRNKASFFVWTNKYTGIAYTCGTAAYINVTDAVDNVFCSYFPVIGSSISYCAAGTVNSNACSGSIQNVNTGVTYSCC